MSVLLAIVLIAFPYINLEIALPIGGWEFNAPLGDLAALAVVLFLAVDLLRAPRLKPPGPVGYAILLVAGLLGLRGAPFASDSLHFLVRKPIFLYLVYGLGVSSIAMRLGKRGIRMPVMAAATVLALLSLYASVDRIAAGSALWPDAPLGLTNNHKTLAVAAAPLIPLLLGLDRRARPVAALLGVAILLSWSRTSWIATFVGLAFFLHVRGRPLAARRGILALGVVVGLIGATYGPIVMKSAVQMDALRSRHSLDKRTWMMFQERPLVGLGGGSNVRVEVSTFPDYRVNGVDAHGVVQKVGSEFGLIGLGGYALFAGAMALRLRGRHVPGDPAWPTFLALHSNLLLSTETFSQTHWAPLALIWGLSQARE